MVYVSSQGENSIFTASKLSILLLRSNEALLDIIIAHSRHSVAFGNWGKMSEQSWDQRDVKPLWIQSMKRTKKSYEIQKISKVTCKLLMILITLQETETYPTLGPWENHHPGRGDMLVPRRGRLWHFRFQISREKKIPFLSAPPRTWSPAWGITISPFSAALEKLVKTVKPNLQRFLCWRFSHLQNRESGSCGSLCFFLWLMESVWNYSDPAAFPSPESLHTQICMWGVCIASEQTMQAYHICQYTHIHI